MTFQEIVDSIGSLSTDDRDRLFDLIRKQRIEEQEAETLVNYRELQQAIKDGTAKKGSVQDLIADLLGDDEFLDFQSTGIQQVSADLVDRVRSLVGNVDIDLDAPLVGKDE
jgi:hypothetical protein